MLDGVCKQAGKHPGSHHEGAVHGQMIILQRWPFFLRAIAFSSGCICNCALMRVCSSVHVSSTPHGLGVPTLSKGLNHLPNSRDVMYFGPDEYRNLSIRETIIS